MNVPKSLGSSTTASNNNNGTKTMMRMTNPDDHQQLMNRLWNWKVAFPKKSDTSLNLWWGLLQEQEEEDRSLQMDRETPNPLLGNY